MPSCLAQSLAHNGDENRVGLARGQDVKVPSSQPDNLEFVLQDPHGGRREVTFEKCPLSSTFIRAEACVSACVYTYMQK